MRATRQAVDHEIAATTNVVRHFREIYDRELYLARGRSSMFQMAVKDFGYDKSKAQRRVNAMELSLAVPEVLEKIDRGQMCLQVAADIQTFLNRERGLKKPYSIQQTRELVETCSGLSTREVQIELATRNPSIDFKESKRYVARDRLRVTHTISTAIEEKLERIRQLRSHANPYMTREELLDFMAEVTLDAIDPARRDARVDKTRAWKRLEKRAIASATGRPAAQMPTVEPEESACEEGAVSERVAYTEEIVSEFGEIQLAAILSETQGAAMSRDALDAAPVRELSAQGVPLMRSRYITAAADRAVRKRNAERGCEFADPSTGHVCGSKHQLQRDHVTPFSHGGSNESENIRLLCSKHNRWSWRSRSVVRADHRAYG